MFTGFAFFASFLMLTTTCIARPVQENVNVEAVEYAKQELANSLEAMFLEMESDHYLNSLIEQLSNDEELNSIVSDIENTEDFDEKISLLSSYVDVLACKPDFSGAISYLESSYSDNLQTVASQVNEFASMSGDGGWIETGVYYVAGVVTYGDDDEDNTEGNPGDENPEPFYTVTWLEAIISLIITILIPIVGPIIMFLIIPMIVIALFMIIGEINEQFPEINQLLMNLLDLILQNFRT
jgi:hypothetical protein